LESGVFALVTALIARLGAVPLAATRSSEHVHTAYMVRSVSLPPRRARRPGIGREIPALPVTPAAPHLSGACSWLRQWRPFAFPRWNPRMYTPVKPSFRSTILLLAAACFSNYSTASRLSPLGSFRGAGDTPRRCLPLHRLLDYWSSLGPGCVSGVDGVRSACGLA